MNHYEKDGYFICGAHQNVLIRKPNGDVQVFQDYRAPGGLREILKDFLRVERRRRAA